jgi:hypothetical protein
MIPVIELYKEKIAKEIKKSASSKVKFHCSLCGVKENGFFTFPCFHALCKYDSFFLFFFSKLGIFFFFSLSECYSSFRNSDNPCPICERYHTRGLKANVTLFVLYSFILLYLFVIKCSSSSLQGFVKPCYKRKTKT